ncbi:MAG TPA: glycoside hydrolase family 5 protein [Acidimicrobiales bacterium]
MLVSAAIKGVARAVVGVLPAGALVGAATFVIPAGTHASTSALTFASSATAGLSVRVAGNALVDGSGRPVRMLGVDRSGTEYACTGGWGIFDGPSDAGSVSTMASWHIDAVRVPLNEDCWLGINGVKPADSGPNYSAAIEGYVSELNAAGIVAILDLHWSAPGTTLAQGQQVMADADHSPAFWSSVASAFKSNPAVVFDLYNEPHDISWSCWRNGCVTSGGWQAAGMQTLVDAVRSTGASQPIMIGGLGWAGDLSGWLANKPVDPDNQLAASVHVYNFGGCSASCWDSTIAPVARTVPVVTGELGEDDCAAGFIDSYMSWADAHGVSYLGWAWDTYSCGGFPALISSYDGTPTAFGAGLKSHLASLSVSGAVATPSPEGYRVAGADGAVYAFGEPAYGSMAGVALNRPIVGLANTGGGGGYWLVGSDGGVFAFGNAPYYGSTGNIRLNQPITGISLDPATGGYWLVASDGGIFSFNAPFDGSTGAIHLNQPVVAMAATPDGRGYWLVARDGGVFTFGDAGFYGSTGAQHLNQPVVGIASTPDGRGYNLVAADGGLFTFGDASYLGSVPGLGIGTTDIVDVSPG